MESNYFTILQLFCHTFDMNQQWVYISSPSWTPLPPPSPSHPSGSSQCTSPEHAVLCIKAGLVICFTYDTIHVSRKWQPTPVLLPGKIHGLRSLVVYSTWGRKELDATEWLHSHFILSNHPTLTFSHRVHETDLYICVSFAVSHGGSSLLSF